MSTNNFIQIIGNLSADPTIGKSKTGKIVASFMVATNDYWKTADGQTQKRVDWHEVEAWEKLTIVCEALLKKGMQVLVVGAHRTDTWKDEKGHFHSKSKIVAEQIRVLSTIKKRVSGEGLDS